MEISKMDPWLESCSTYDSDETGSSCESEDSNDPHRMEPVRVNGESLFLPQGLCDSPEIFREFVSFDTFRGLSDAEKDHLMNFLPDFPERDREEKEKTLRMLLGGENIRFGNPLVEFHNQLQAAYFRPDIGKMRALLRRARFKDYKRAERWRQFDLVKNVLGSRQRLFDTVLNGEKPKVGPLPSRNASNPHAQAVKTRYFQELALIRGEVGESSQSSEDENYPEGPTMSHRKSRRPSASALVDMFEDGLQPIVGTLSSGPAPWDYSKSQTNPYVSQEQSYSQMLLSHSKRRTKKEEHLSLLTDGISLQEIASRSKSLKRPPSSKPPKKPKVKSSRSVSTSSPVVEDFEMDDSTASEGTIVLPPPKPEPEEDPERVDIEAVDDLPPLPSFRNTAPPLPRNPPPSSPLAPSPPKPKGMSPVRKPKLEPEPAPKRPSVEVIEPPIKKVKIEPPEPRPRKVRSESVDIKKVKVEPIPELKKPKIETIEPSGNVKVETIDNSLSPVFNMPGIKNMASRILTPATLSDLDGIDMMDLPVDFDESSALSLDDMKPRPELMQETHACFFSLIRDILTSTPDHRIEMRELESRVKAWANSPIGPINHWYSFQLESQLLSAVQFLAGDSSEILPDDYVPYMEYKPAVSAYQWIGAGRDSDHRLVTLCSLWLERGADRSCPSSKVIEKPAEVEPAVAPPPRGPAVQPSSPRDREVFRAQEKIRFENPTKSFTYRIGVTETVVGPVRSSGATNNAKARGHTLLVDDRPNHITILELVRDAIARLPNSQGTRADIVTLLKDSQYLLEGAQENVLSSVVSGALDRLQSEKDPCVKYDGKRKIWVYLHKSRTEEEFEMIHAMGLDTKPAKPKPQRKPPKPKKDLPSKEEGTATSAEPSPEPSILTIRTSVASETSPLVASLQSRPTMQKVTVPRKLIADGGVKSLLAKSRVKTEPLMGHLGTSQFLIQQKFEQVQAALNPQTLPQSQTNQTVQTIKTGEIQKVVASTVPTRIIQEATPKKTPVTLADQLQKQGAKSIVKVIASTQAPVRAQMQRTPVTPQQVIQLKQQLVDQKILQKGTTAIVKKQGVVGNPQQQQQQLIVMKQTGTEQGGTQQQMFVINQQQVVVDQQLTVKQQKQLQQLLNKQQLEQQLIVKQSGKANQAPQQQMIVVKQQQSVGEGVKSQPLQQMILVKQQSQQGQGETTHQITQQQLQQMLLLKQQQQQQAATTSSQPQQQQMIIVKQDQKAVQVIQAQAKGAPQQITFTQLQQLHQQQRNAGTASLITHPRVVTHGSIVTTAAGASLIKPQGTTTMSPVMAKVVSNAQGAQVLSMESLLTHKPQTITQQAGVRMPVTRTIPSQQYTVVSMPQQRVVQTTVTGQSTSTSVVATVSQDQSSPKVVTTAGNVRIPGLNLAQIAGKQVLLASKPQSIQGQNVILGNAGGQTVLVASQSNPGQQGTLTVLQQGSQQILIPPGAINLKALQGIKVIPLAKQTQPGKQQVFARIINPTGARPTVVANVVPHPTTVAQESSPAPSKDSVQ